MSLCESCHAGCCRAFAVPVTGADVFRLEKDLGLSFWEFACRWADPHGRIAKNHAPHFYFADEPHTPFAICLRHEVSAFLPDSTKCRFLVECPPDAEHPRGVARCGVYSSRPSACRTFPTKLSDSGDLVILCDVPPSDRTSDNPAYALCPRPWEPSEIDPVQSAGDLVVAKYEMAFFRHVAEVWNRRPQAWELFPDFLRLVYSERVQRETTADEAGQDEPVLLPFPNCSHATNSRAA